MDSMIWMSGYVGSEVEYREFREDLAYASFRMACTPRLRRGGEWVDGETTWIGVTCSRALAENVRVSLAKGDPVIVAGRLRTQRWQGKEGEPQERLTIAAEVIGHDLGRGVSAFTKRSRVSKPSEPEDLGEMLEATEASDGDAERAA